HLQGAVRGRSARRLLPGLDRPGTRSAVRDLPPALLDEHDPVMGARAAFPAALPQRRDQLHRRQRRLDAVARTRARDGRVRLDACASEAGALPLPEGARIRRGRLGPGQMLVVDPALGIEENGTIKPRLARKRPYGRWLRATVHPFDTGVPVEPPTEALTARQVRAGFTREDLSLLLRPSA